MVLNFTLIALSISNICASPMFSIGRNKATFSYLNIHNSFASSILAKHSLHVSNSNFKNILSSAVVLSSSNLIPNLKVGNAFFSTTLDDRTYCQNRASTGNSNNGAAVYLNNSLFNAVIITRCLFANCYALNQGGAIYTNISGCAITINNVRIFSCTAHEGSSFYINNAGEVNFNFNSIEESSPSRLSGIKSNGVIISRINNLKYSNFTSCYSIRSSGALLLDCSESQAISFINFQHCTGYNIVNFKGVGYSSLSHIRNIVMVNNSINGNQTANGEDIYEGKAIISIMGNWEISYSFFYSNNGLLATGGYGIISFLRCKFDISSELIENDYVSLNECFFNINNLYNEIPINVYTINSRINQCPPFFQGETPNNMIDPPKPKFIMKKKIGYIIGGIVFTIIFIVITIYACILLRNHRQHVLCMLHREYAFDGKSSDEGNEKNQKKDVIVVVDEDTKKEKEKKKKDLQNDFDDFYDTVRKDKRFQFEDIPVPDTHLWDTNEGDVEIPDDDAFSSGAEKIMEKFLQKRKSTKKTNKRKK